MNGKIEIETTGRLAEEKTIEEILCLSTLIVGGILPVDSSVKDSQDYFDLLPLPGGDCSACPLNQKCLACLINE